MRVSTYLCILVVAIGGMNSRRAAGLREALIVVFFHISRRPELVLHLIIAEKAEIGTDALLIDVKGPRRY